MSKTSVGNPFNRPIHSFRLGDQARVKVLRVNAFRSKIDFELVQTGKDRP